MKRVLVIAVLVPVVAALAVTGLILAGECCYTKLTEILTGQRPRYYDAVHHKWVTAPMTQTTPLLTSSHEA
ncbi:MAG: hypothetical protein ACRDOD_11630 [Streptosporangiaceae bacterium]